MKESRFSEQQIAFILRQAEDGTSVEEVCRKADISIQTCYRWRSKYAGLMPSERKRLKVLEEENVRLKRLVTNLSLDNEMLQDVIRRKMQGLIEPGRSSAICRRATRPANGEPTARFRSIDRPGVISPAASIRPASRCGSRSWLRPVFATGIDASTCCSSGRAGRSITSAPIACIGNQGCNCATRRPNTK